MEKVCVTGFGAFCEQIGARRVWNEQSPTPDGDFRPDDGGVLRALGHLARAKKFDRTRCGVSLGSSKGWRRDGDGFSWAPDWFALDAARRLEFHGPILAPVAACATGAHALALGAQLVQDGKCEVVLAGAVEPPQHEMIIAAYKNMGALSKSGKMRPFDRRRDGFLPSTGAGFMVLESETHARTRKAEILGFLTGWSMKCDATHMTAMCPSGNSITRAIEDALKRAGSPEIGYINAHGTATKINDAIESRAIESVFGTKIPVSSTKPLTGHLLGAAGAVEAVISLLALRQNFAPPTLNLEEPDETLNLDYIPLHGRAIEMDAVLSLNYGFGGHIGALIFTKTR